MPQETHPRLGSQPFTSWPVSRMARGCFRLRHGCQGQNLAPCRWSTGPRCVCHHPPRFTATGTRIGSGMCVYDLAWAGMDPGVKEHVMPLADVKLGWWIRSEEGGVG